MIKQIPIIEIELETLIIDSYKLLCSYLILFIMKVIQKHWIYYFKFKGYDPDNLNCDKVSVVFDDYKYNRLKDIMNDELDDIQEPNIIVLIDFLHLGPSYGELIDNTFKSIQTYYNNNIYIDDILNWFYLSTVEVPGGGTDCTLGTVRVHVSEDTTEVTIDNIITGKLILSTLDIDKFNMKVYKPLHRPQSTRWKIPFVTSDYSLLVNSNYHRPRYSDSGFYIITSRNQDRIFNNTLTYFKPSTTYKVYTCKFGLFTIRYDFLIKEVAEVDNSLKYPITDTSVNDFNLNVNDLSFNIKFNNDNSGIATINYINILNGTNNTILLLGVNNTTRIMRLSPTTSHFTQMMLLSEEIKVKKNMSFFII